MKELKTLYDPLVSIVIITFNRREELLHAIESVFKQTYKNIEVIVFDNASNNETDKCIKVLYPQIKILRTYKNLGCPIARNISFANCNGEIIFSLDDDGWLDKNCIERIVSCFRENENNNIAVVSCNIIIVDNNYQKKEKLKNLKYKNVSLFSGGAFAIKKNILDKIGYFPDYFRQGEETYLALKLLDNGYKIIYNPYAIMYHKPSLQNRIKEKILFYGFKNDIENMKRLLPFPYNFPVITWKLLSHLKLYIKNKFLTKYFVDLFRIIPIIFKEYNEKKIKWSTFKLFRCLRNG